MFRALRRCQIIAAGLCHTGWMCALHTQRVTRRCLYPSTSRPFVFQLLSPCLALPPDRAGVNAISTIQTAHREVTLPRHEKRHENPRRDFRIPRAQRRFHSARSRAPSDRSESDPIRKRAPRRREFTRFALDDRAAAGLCKVKEERLARSGRLFPWERSRKKQPERGGEREKEKTARESLFSVSSSRSSRLLSNET